MFYLYIKDFGNARDAAPKIRFRSVQLQSTSLDHVTRSDPKRKDPEPQVRTRLQPLRVRRGQQGWLLPTYPADYLPQILRLKELYGVLECRTSIGRWSGKLRQISSLVRVRPIDLI